MTSIQIATTDDQLRACYPVMVQLRTHLESQAFVIQAQRQMQCGYQLAYLSNSEGVCSVAGFRISESLSWGRFLYVDDLITDAQMRSQNYGHQLLDWLIQYARQQDCAQLHLDSGLQRLDAHRFYQREGLQISSYHFVLKL
ncbi:GNAT family N-acetyltransferase [Acaryochloris sp. 'Moss Beach']|uniref:GNAT family N-acetyltransferase n=1 Tax=Acaryochloris sp. 'Moss Beach' TaxID=2740837 RepID=UPI001F3E1BC9|nr:GNAT family N-acetyltransferase [Acaryochloris sp. 'Moss Beach']UJB68659.1 GNAT family N-acetyltransferase [Acaryochloris sp. 'Moss Beach']